MSQNREVAKRVNIVRVKMVREASLLYPQRRIRMARDVVELFQTFLQETDREQFFLLCLNTKNEPTALHTVSIGSLDASIVHPREVVQGSHPLQRRVGHCSAQPSQRRSYTKQGGHSGDEETARGRRVARHHSAGSRNCGYRRSLHKPQRRGTDVT